MRNLLSPCNDTDLIDCANLGAQTTVYAEDLAIDNSSEDEEVKDMAAGLPNGCVAIFLLAFLVKAVYLCNLSGFVVAPNEDDSIRRSVSAW